MHRAEIRTTFSDTRFDPINAKAELFFVSFR